MKREDLMCCRITESSGRDEDSAACHDHRAGGCSSSISNQKDTSEDNTATTSCCCLEDLAGCALVERWELFKVDLQEPRLQLLYKEASLQEKYQQREGNVTGEVS